MKFTINTFDSKQYGLTMHINNLLLTVSDNLRAIANLNISLLVSHYEPYISTISDYYPFGMPMAERSYQSEKYRFGFNGQEKVDEVSGFGNHNTAEFWEYDTRIGRRWNLDPVIKPNESPYATFANNPIWLIDRNGLDTIMNPNGEKWNAGDGYKATRKGKFLKGDGLQTKKWDPTIQQAYSKGDYVNYKPKISSFFQAFVAGLSGFVSHIQCDGEVLEKIQTDRNYLKFESTLISAIKDDARFKSNQSFSGNLIDYPIDPLVAFGGNISSTPMYIQGIITAIFPGISTLLFPETWDVANHEITWLVRKTNLDVKFDVDKNQNISLHYSFEDKLDLKPDWKNQETTYNLMVLPLGAIYHGILGGRKDMKVKASWSKTITQ